MDIYLRGNNFGYEMRNVAALFFERPVVHERRPAPAERKADHIYIARFAVRGSYTLLCAVRYNGCAAAARAFADERAGDKECERKLGALLFTMLCDLTGTRPVWGISTGVRPAKFAAAMLEKSAPKAVIKTLREDYYIQPDKAALCIEAARASLAAAKRSEPSSFSLYVSIPFCPTRCAYCSFVSKETTREGALVEPYLELLCREIAETAAIAKRLGLKLATAYVGGGTPTVLSAEQLERLLGCINGNFDIAAAAEYCVEAGRPDTITREKLEVMKRAGVSRISINPQTKHQAILDAIGRRHTAKDVEAAFALAREAGFTDINADVIIGLPGDTLGGFQETLEWVLGLGASGVTVHALTLKRASFLREQKTSAAEGALAMTRYASERLRAAGMNPYYMYKQKSTVDSLENTGYCLPGHEGLYNIYMMDEVHTVLGCGAGAVTKLKQPRGERIERIFNYKYPAEYIDGFETLLARKAGIKEFYDGYI